MISRRPMNELSIASTKEIYHKGSGIDDDILLFDNVADLPLPREARRVQCLLMAVCLEGQAKYTVDTEVHTVNANDIIIISEGQVTTDFMLSDDCKGVSMMISKEFFNEVLSGVHELSALFLFARNHPVYRLREEEVELILTYFNLIKRKADDSTHHFRKDTVRLLINTMIYDLSNVIYREQHTADKVRADFIFTNFIKLVEENFKSERRVSWYSQEMKLSAKYLSESVKEVSHRTPNEWIDNYLLQEIKVQLKNTSKSVKEIAAELNFSTQSFLGKFFRDHIGMSPTEYRRQL